MVFHIDCELVKGTMNLLIWSSKGLTCERGTWSFSVRVDRMRERERNRLVLYGFCGLLCVIRCPIELFSRFQYVLIRGCEMSWMGVLVVSSLFACRSATFGLCVEFQVMHIVIEVARMIDFALYGYQVAVTDWLIHGLI